MDRCFNISKITDAAKNIEVHNISIATKIVLADSGFSFSGQV